MAGQERAKRKAAEETGEVLRAMVSSTETSSEPVDRLIHERIRLAILSALAVNDALSFSDLKQLLETTDGNLSVHARKLEDADYIICTKGFEGRVPRTEYHITDSGRHALEKYLNHMEQLIKAVRKR